MTPDAFVVDPVIVENVLRSCVDEPRTGSVVSPAGCAVVGWVVRADGLAVRAVRAVVDGETIGGTTLVYPRDDVNASFELPADLPTGFAFRIDRLPLGREVRVDLVATFDDGAETFESLALRTSDFDVTNEHYGTLGDPAFDVVLHREHVYSVGPSSPIADPSCVALIVERTGPGDRVVDVGCGVGAYAEPLVAAGRAWHGCEVVPEFVDAIRDRGLDVTLASGTTLPFDDGAFDVAIAIEVVEHIDDFAAFARELARVARRGAFVSVPNAGAIPLYAPLGVVPWHLLESSHVNFFTVASLRRLLAESFAHVEVIEYGRLPVDAADGTPVYNHLFASAVHDVEPAG